MIIKKHLREPIRSLKQPEMEILHQNALRILAEVGMHIDHDEALETLHSNGCKVDFSKRHVLFPEAIVQKYVDKMKADFATRQQPEKMAVRYSHIRFRKEPFHIREDFTVSAGGYCVFIYDLDGKRRLATLEDTRQALKLVEQLDQITYSGLPVAAQDIPLPTRQIRMAAELVKNTRKLGGIEALDPFDIEYICRIGDVVRGSREELKRNPILIGYAEARSPLSLDRNMCEIFLTYLKMGMPQSLDTMPNAGMTAPMHPAGVLALGLAETLGGLSLAYAFDENAVVTIDITPSVSDMTTGLYKYAGAERVSLLGARIQMISEFYGCPSGVHGGKTDSCVPDVRCGVEKGISMLMPILHGAVGFGTVGHLENALTFSPVQLVLDNETARYVRHAIKGFEISDESINLDLIKRVGIGGNYLNEPDTAAQFQDILNLSPFFTAEPWGTNPSSDESRRWEKMAHERVKDLLSNEVESPLSEDQVRAVDEIVAEAEAKRKEQI